METEGIVRFDWAIKRLLRNKADYTVLEGFLTELLKEEITIVSINESESNKSHALDKFNRVDLIATDSRGVLLIIELQINYQVDYYFRMLYSVSKSITEHIKEGNRYAMIKKIYHINIIYFEIGESSDYVYHGSTEFRGIHSNHILQLSDRQKKFFLREKVMELFPEYYVLCVNSFDDITKDKLDEWIYYFKNSSIPEGFTARGLKEARERFHYQQLSDDEKREYRGHLQQNIYEQSVIEDSEAKGKAEGLIEGEAKGKAKGLIEGEAKGEAKGLIEGEAKGKAKGLIEGEAKGKAKGLIEGEAKGLEKGRKQIVINSFNTGYSIEEIAAFTGISPDEIAQIAKV